MKYLFVSKELLVVPRMAIGADGKPAVVPGKFDYVPAREGHTYRRPTPRVRKPKGNRWGAEWYVKLRKRREAGVEQRKIAAAWAELQAKNEQL